MVIQNRSVLDIKPLISSIESTSGVVVGTWAYNQAGFTYNQAGLQYGGFAGGINSAPQNQDVLI